MCASQTRIETQLGIPSQEIGASVKQSWKWLWEFLILSFTHDSNIILIFRECQLHHQSQIHCLWWTGSWSYSISIGECRKRERERERSSISLSYSLVQFPLSFSLCRSLADQDTDRWVHECLAPDLRVKMKNLMNQVQFTDLCASLLDELHQRGVSQDQIKQAMQSMPIVSITRKSIQFCHEGRKEGAAHQRRRNWVLIHPFFLLAIQSSLHLQFHKASSNDQLGQIFKSIP